MNGEGLVVPVLFWAQDIDVGVDASFGHGGEARRRGDLGVGGGIGPMCLISDRGGGYEVVSIGWILILERRDAHVRRVRNRRTRGNDRAH